ncbi:MAG: response regulator [Burkholderiales bacterium]
MSGNALIVESNDMLVRMYRAIFSALDCSVVHARTREEARRLLRGASPNLIVVDERLADGLGIDAVREIRMNRDFLKTPIIATISRRGSVEDGDLRALGVASVVTKPWQFSAFSQLAKNYLNNPSAVVS